MISIFKHTFAFSICLLSIFGTAYAQNDEEMEMLLLFYKPESLVVSATRSEKPISQAAENISVITSRDIARIHAHTLLDVLVHVTGVQVSFNGGPGFPGIVAIQGSESRHVLVLIDDVPINNLSENFPDIAAIPVENIERVEIIKGPASSAWGSSLGGVINVITKGPTDVRGGSAYVSRGKENTSSVGSDVSGREGRLGYYVHAGAFDTEGLIPNQYVNSRNAYTKLDYHLTEGSRLFGTFNYNEGTRGLGQFDDFGFKADNDFEYQFFTLGYDAELPMEGDLSISYHHSEQDATYAYSLLDSGFVFQKDSYKDDVQGGSMKLSVRPSGHLITVGGDYDSETLKSDAIEDGEQSLDKWAVYVNDTVSIGGLAVTPGVRYDDTDTYGDFTSPSLGLAYAVSKGTVLRAFAARGFNAPPLGNIYGTGVFSVPNPDLEVEKVWSYQAGAETSDIPYVWVKATLFRHDIEDGLTTKALSGGKFTYDNEDRIRREGVEVELATDPVLNTSLLLGYSYVEVENRKTGKTLDDTSHITANAGLVYEGASYRCTLKGRYIDWNADETNGAEDDVIWDLFASRKFGGMKHKGGKIYLAVYNLFDGEQYLNELYPNPGRWVEGGFRFAF